MMTGDRRTPAVAMMGNTAVVDTERLIGTACAWSGALNDGVSFSA